MKKGYFITGTDTHVGKTWATIALMHYFKKKGETVAGMKPIASGCNRQNGKLVNEDALLMQANASIKLDYDLINPYAYRLSVSPHLAGIDNPVSLDFIMARFNEMKPQADIVLVEGAGGWYVPINELQHISDLAISLALPVIIVVAIRLGCINHAMLTLEAVNRSGLHCAGWIAVCLDPNMKKIEDNIRRINEGFNASLLGVLPFMEKADFDLMAEQLRL
ncbi:MAG: dethiobiotin synthase [Methylosarcina sp.]